MTDRELLELAAKAAGYTINANAMLWREAALPPEKCSLWIDDVSTAWNPLTDSSHALDLSVKLRLSVEHYNDSSQPEPWLRVVDRDGRWTHAGPSVEFSADPLAATRRAIVRAAAAIGEAMKP